VALLDFEQPKRNDWLAVQQFVVINGQVNRRPDVVVFVNGLPLAVIELKAPGSAERASGGCVQPVADLQAADSRAVPHQCLLVTSDGIAARVGSLSADLERFMPWRTTDGAAIAPKGLPELGT
jgi:type I restriction enzyme R subunit